MRKRLIAPFTESAPSQEKEWLDLDKLAEIEISSEDSHRPIDFALLPGDESGWSATQSGPQRLRIIFDEPQDIKLIRLVFTEDHHSRTQEFVLRWSKSGKLFREIVRQQYNFNPPATETEEYRVELHQVKTLELKIIPNINGGGAHATLKELRLA
jgi:hypothetical protein